jgi:hypothetical protein
MPLPPGNVRCVTKLKLRCWSHKVTWSDVRSGRREWVSKKSQVFLVAKLSTNLFKIQSATIPKSRRPDGGSTKFKQTRSRSSPCVTWSEDLRTALLKPCLFKGLIGALAILLFVHTTLDAYPGSHGTNVWGWGRHLHEMGYVFQTNSISIIQKWHVTSLPTVYCTCLRVTLKCHMQTSCSNGVLPSISFWEYSLKLLGVRTLNSLLPVWLSLSFQLHCYNLVLLKWIISQYILTVQLGYNRWLHLIIEVTILSYYIWLYMLSLTSW